MTLLKTKKLKTSTPKGSPAATASAHPKSTSKSGSKGGEKSPAQRLKEMQMQFASLKEEHMMIEKKIEHIKTVTALKEKLTRDLRDLEAEAFGEEDLGEEDEGEEDEKPRSINYPDFEAAIRQVQAL